MPAVCHTRALSGSGGTLLPAMSALFELPVDDPVQPATQRGAALLEGLNPRQRQAVTHAGSPLLIVAGAGFGQDARAHPPHRLAAGRAARAPRRDHVDHVHQQGRGRDEGQGRCAGRAPGQRDVGVHVPLDVRAHPAQGGQAPRGAQRLLRLRRRRHAPPGRARHPRSRARSEEVRAAGRRRADLEPQERAALARRRHGARGAGVRAQGRRGLRGLPGAAAHGQRVRLR